MKRFSIVLLVLTLASLALVVPALAQNAADVIVLDSATPAIDVVISLPADTTGTIALDFSGALVRLTDANGNTVFEAADPRLHGLELNIAPNSGSHTLTVERLPGVVEALVHVSSLPELSQFGISDLVPGLSITPAQEVSLSLDATHPGDTVNLNIPGDSAGIVTAIFPGLAATTQLVDASGVLMAQSGSRSVDGLNLLVDPGAYQFTVLGSDMLNEVIAGVRLASARDAGISILQAPEAPVNTVSDTTTSSDSAAPCTGVLNVSSANLRSGPGTGYTILGYGYRDQAFTIGGRNPEDNWLVVSTESGSAWVARSNVQLQGDCNALTTFNIPLQDAQPFPLIITSAEQPGGYHDDEEAGEHHESGEREEEGEHDD